MCFIISVDRKLFAAKTHADKSFDLMEIAFRLEPNFKDPLFPDGDAYAFAGNQRSIHADDSKTHGI